MSLLSWFYATNDSCSEFLLMLGIICYSFMSNLLAMVFTYWCGGCYEHYFNNGTWFHFEAKIIKNWPKDFRSLEEVRRNCAKYQLCQLPFSNEIRV
jgi:hypothetical protein